MNISGVISVLFLPEISAKSSASRVPREHKVHVWLRSHWFEIGFSVQLVSRSLLGWDNSAYEARRLDPLVMGCGSVGAAN